MGAFATYTFESGIYLLVGYLIYKWLLSAENQPAFNRCILLSIYAISFIAPLLPTHGFADVASGAGGMVQVEEIDVELLPGKVPAWARICVISYYIGVIVTTLFFILSILSLLAILRRGEVQKMDSYSLILLQDTKMGTFSWLRYIVINRKDYEDAGETILIHECAHLRLLHGIDLFVAQLIIILLWYNPASWLMRAELRSVHEYQADDVVLQSGVDARQYQLLLTKKAVGQRFPSLANSLNHSKLKNRITMMCNQKTSPMRRLRSVAIVPALLVAAVAVNNPAVAAAIGTASAVSLSVDKVSEKIPSAQVPEAPVKPEELAEPDVMPEFPGGQMAMYKFLADNTKYPEETVKNKAQGKVAVRFVITAEGKVTDLSVVKSVSPEIDAEAMRVISIMPAWTPATKNGSPVSCSMVVPMTFKLP